MVKITANKGNNLKQKDPRFLRDPLKVVKEMGKVLWSFKVPLVECY